MSTFVIVLILVVIGVFGVKSYCKKLSSGCCGASSGPSEKKMKVKDRDKSHYPYRKILSIDGMVCGNCSTRVENGLNRLDGVWAVVDLAKGQADVRMKEPLDEQVLKQAVRDTGYTVYKIETAS